MRAATCSGDEDEVSLAAHRRTTRQAVSSAWIRGYVTAVAGFAHQKTEATLALAAADITRARAVASGVHAADLRTLRGLWPKPTVRP